MSLYSLSDVCIEDDTRKVQAELNGVFASPKVHVRHLERLHPHDAVVWSYMPECSSSA